MRPVETRVVRTVFLPQPVVADEFRQVHSPINDWMIDGAYRSPELAVSQADNLADTFLALGAGVIRVRQKIGPPPDFGQDGIFCKDQAYIFERDGEEVALMPHFRHFQRRHETDYYSKFLETLRIKPEYPPEGVDFEVADLVDWHDGGFLLFYGERTDPEAKPWIEEQTDRQVRLVETADRTWYHSDLSFKPLGRDQAYPILWYPHAFSDEAQQFIRGSGRELIELTLYEAYHKLWAQVVPTDHTLIIPPDSELESRVRSWGFNTAPVDLSEYAKLGGGADCLKLIRRWDIYNTNV